LPGQLIKELIKTSQNASGQQIVFNADNQPSGGYFYSMSAVSLDRKQEYSSTTKMILLK
jgi:hypothetical protein